VRENSTGATLQLDYTASKNPVTLLLNFGAKPWPIDPKLASESELLLDSSKRKWSDVNESPGKVTSEKEKAVAPFSAVLLKITKSKSQLTPTDTH
jgi:hypothetical protein